MKRLSYCALLLALLVCLSFADLTGCYMCRTKDYAVFLKLKQTRSNLTGTMQVLSPNPEHGEPDLTDYYLDGNAADSTFSLLREDIDTSGRHIIGTAAKDMIKLSVPASDGSFAKLDMRKGTLESLQSFARTYSAECATKFNRRIWRGWLMQWTDGMDSTEAYFQQLVDSATAGIQPVQKKVDELNAGLELFQKSITDANEDIARKAASVSELQKVASRLDKEMQENWSAQVQHQFQDVKTKLDASVVDLKGSQDKANKATQELEAATRYKGAAEQELYSAMSARDSAKAQLRTFIEFRKVVRESGFSKHLRNWKPDTCARARVVGIASVYVYPDPKTDPMGTLDAPTIVDVLPLDGDWWIIRYQGTLPVWVRATSLKLLLN